MKIWMTGLFSVLVILGFAQRADWQQKVDYTMSIDFNHEKHQFSGTQKLVYTNNSPDDLDKVYYHLYFNAFQPMSMMDVRQRMLPDPDARIGSRVLGLEDDEIGYHKVLSLTQDGQAVDYEIRQTVLIVQLDHSIKAGKKSVFEMAFKSQVPVQIRRSGRNNKEGIDYSMAQWYPKMAEYDYEGWHPDPYIAREFHAVWGNFDVTIEMDSAFTIAATGVLKNAKEIGKGYATQKEKYASNNRLRWNFKVENVHDFAWAADRDYRHDIVEMENGPDFHFFYQGNDTATVSNWKKLPRYAIQCAEIMNRDYGVYPYPHYSVVQGGDGGMEYPMLTLISGKGSLPSLMSVTIHEYVHSWYQGVLGSNEQKHPWMDEGFTQYVQGRIKSEIRGSERNITAKSTYATYTSYAKSELHEPMSVFADYYATNKAYGSNSYYKGYIFLHQLSYIIGEDAFLRTMRSYYDEWKFKHPDPSDFIRIAEKESGIELDWYYNHWLQTDHNIDYAVKAVESEGSASNIILEMKDRVPMPIELRVLTMDGEEHWYYIPLLTMWGEKSPEGNPDRWEVKSPWPWVYPEYVLSVPFAKEHIESIEIDPSGRIADIEVEDNSWPKKDNTDFQMYAE